VRGLIHWVGKREPFFWARERYILVDASSLLFPQEREEGVNFFAKKSRSTTTTEEKEKEEF